nr:retrovirus-related Pol polyprotein from transposon TNT 1-94 [Tanacetum cinerariifolium]
MHNNIMAAGSRDRPPMLATRRYAQWRSWFLRYIDTRPNGDALRKCILEGPYIPTNVIVPVVPATDDSPTVPKHTTVETPMNMSPENKAHYESKKEAIHLILTGIGDEIYSTVDAYTDEEINEQELEAHYSYMAKIQEVPTADSSTDSEPLEQVQYNDEYNVFANVNQHCEQSESTGNTCLVEKDDNDVTPDSPDMCEHDIQTDQNAEDEHDALANLIANLKLDYKSILSKTSKTLEESNSVRDSCLVALQTKQTEFEKYKACNYCTVDYDKLELDSNHFACVTKMLNDVNARTKKPNAVPISTRKPKSQAKNLLQHLIVQLILFIVDSGCTKHMTRNLSMLCNFVEKYLGIVRFGNDQFAPILSYGDLVEGNITINMVYYVEGLNHNLFSVGQFCDADLEVTFWKSTCFARDLQGNDLLTGNRGSDLYTISLQETASSNPLCLMAKASPTQPWLCSFKTKNIPSLKGRLTLLHMDLCGPMRVASINGKKYILNGVVERRNCTLVEAARTMLSVGNKMHKAFPLLEESSHWQYNFPLPV